MNRKQNGRLFFYLAIFCLFLCACSTTQSVETETSNQDGFVSIRDYSGEIITVKQNPTYVAPIFSTVCHFLAMFGDVEKIVAISGGNTRDYLFCEIFPQILDARIVKQNSEINIEETVRDPKPEIVFNNLESAEESSTKTFEKMGIPVVLVGFDSVDQQIEMAQMLGEIMGRQTEAAKYVDYYREMLDLVTKRTAQIPEDQQKTVYHAVNELLRTDQAGSLSADWLKRINVKTVAEEIHQEESLIPAGKNYIALEELLQADPEYIIINGADVYDYIQNKDFLHSLKAYQNENIYIMPLGISRWGHPNSIETPLGILWTAKTIYPELFEDIDMAEETRRFYHDMFEYELSDEQIEKILEGRAYKLIKGSGG